jgi:putative membrane-bound dehydrogenase-like protein
MGIRTSSLVLVLGGVVLLHGGCRDQEGPPYEPEEALETFQLPPGFRIELVASEPQITDPVDLSFDADGRLYVAEMPDYPDNESDSITSRIKLLEDRDGDGFYEKSTIFAEDLPFVNGVMAWRNGVLVTKAPEILYFEDTDGDNRADVRRVVMTGFAVTNPQLRMSNLEYGLDNWIYGAYSKASSGSRHPEHDDHGRALRFPDNPVPDSADIYPGTDFRFRPDQFVVQPAGGMSQFGNAFDAAGNRFTVWNSKHLQHVVIPHRYLARNPSLSVGSVMASIPDHGDAATVYPITKNPLNLHESEIGHFTSASGTSIYTGGLFEGEYRDAAFVTEPVHNLVHVDLLTPTGATFVAKQAREGKEFLSSTDSWFRPVNTTVGPDGALYVADFYRKLIEHPAWIAQADSGGLYTFAGRLQESDFLEGQDRGRIYRIVPKNAPERAAERPKLSSAPSAALVAHLANPNMWWRTTAQRLLVDRQDRSVVPALRKLAAESPSSEGRVHALWTLQGLGTLDDALVLRALEEKSVLVREQAVRLAEMRLSNPEIQQRLTRMAQDPGDRVQFQLALTLGDLPADRSFDALRQIALRHLEDPWFQTAVLTGAADNPLQWFAAALQAEPASKEAAEGKARFLHRIASVIGARQQDQEVATVLASMKEGGESRWQVAVLEGIGEGLGRGNRRNFQLSQAAQANLLHLVGASSSEVQEAALEAASGVELRSSPALRAAGDRAAKIASDANAPTAARVRAVRVLGLDPRPNTMQFLERLLDPRHPVELQLAAAEMLAEMDDPGATSALLERWDSYPSAVREVVEKGLLGRTGRITAFLDAIDAGAAEPSRLSRSGRTRLIGHPDEAIRQRAQAAFRDLQDDRREDVIRRYHEATRLEGDAAKGKAAFQAVCSACHRLDGIGHEVGPALSSMTSRTRIDLMTQILDPNDNIAPGYEAYVVETAGGKTFSGVMAEESAVSIVLRSPGGAEQMIQRNNIGRVQPLPVSLMPEGLEGSMSVQQMADLLSYLKGLQ